MNAVGIISWSVVASLDKIELMVEFPAFLWRFACLLLYFRVLELFVMGKLLAHSRRKKQLSYIVKGRYCFNRAS